MNYVPVGWFQRSNGYVAFPHQLAAYYSALIFTSLYIARIPGLYTSFNAFPDDDENTDALGTYQNALLVVILSIVPIFFLSQYWSISYMLFRKEFTACPGNYNGIHDPTISMVVLNMMTEGSIDMLSTSALLQLASDGEEFIYIFIFTYTYQLM